MAQYTLRKIPEDIWEFILEEQLRLKLRKKCNISISTTVAIMMRDYKKCREQNNFTPDGERD
jgi:hypothetical protein